jgi:hypothetical protein
MTPFIMFAPINIRTSSEKIWVVFLIGERHIVGPIHSWGSIKRKKDIKTFFTLCFVNNIYTKKHLSEKI